MQPYKYKEFPRVVYGSGGATAIINSEDERPDGYVNDPAGPSGDDSGSKTRKTAGRKSARRAKGTSEEATERAMIINFLDEHDVVYPSDGSIEQLRVLSDELSEYLAAQERTDGDGA